MVGILRIVSWVLLALAFALLGADAISTKELGEPVIRTTAEIMQLFNVPAPVPVDPKRAVVRTAAFLLNAPLWAIIGSLGVIMTLLFRPIE